MEYSLIYRTLFAICTILTSCNNGIIKHGHLFDLALYTFKILFSRVFVTSSCVTEIKMCLTDSNQIDYWIYVDFMISFVRPSLLPDGSAVYFTRSCERRGKDH